MIVDNVLQEYIIFIDNVLHKYESRYEINFTHVSLVKAFQFDIRH